MGRSRNELPTKKFKEVENQEFLENLVVEFINKNPNKGGNATRGFWNEEMLEVRNMLVLNLIRNGLSRQRCKEYMKQHWGVSFTTGDKYYTEAIESLVTESDTVRNAARKIAIERLTGLMERARERGNTDSELRALDQLNKINGLYSEKKEVEITGLQFDFGERE